ncbi:hypothetical protein [Methanobrevibacter sp.]|uniref:hypothetical protein n=1 Tax=Methanobrevibacter sp. TaxID=66852 RepID=UPI00388CF2F9
MKKIVIISILLILISISCIYANDNIENNTNETSNKKYYVDYHYYFYENGTTGYIDPWNNEINHKTPILNQEQINYYIENGDFSYALAYLKYANAHGKNLTYDEVYNAEGIHGDYKKTKDWIFYNNGTVTRNITLYYENGTNKTIPYSTTYKTSIFGTAQWIDVPYAFEDDRPVITIESDLIRRADGVFFTDEEIIVRENSTTNQTMDINNLTKDNTSINNTNTTQHKQTNNTNTTQHKQTNNTNTTQTNNLKPIISAMRNTANPLILLLIACLIPLGIQKNKNNKK